MRAIITVLTLFTLVFSQAFAKNNFAAEQWETANGAQVIFYPAMEVPILDISIAFRAGSAYDGKQFGIGALTAELLNQGNAGLNANTMAERLADTGAQYESESNRDMAVFSLRTLTAPKTLALAIKNFSLIINRPDFPVNSFAREKNQQLMAINHSLESPDTVASQAFFSSLYKSHPYGHPIIGYKKQVQDIQPNDIRNFYQKHYVGSNAVIVLVGAIDSKNAHQIAEQIMHDRPKGEAAPSIPKAQAVRKSKQQNLPFPSSQTIIRLGQLGITHQDEDYFPLIVGNYILGGGSLVSNLAIELREKRGLTYGVSSQFSPMPGVGPFIIGLSTKNDQAKTAIELTEKTLSSFVKHGPSGEELTAAKRYLTGNFQLSLASNRNIANVLLKMVFYQLPKDYLDTYLDQIKRVSKSQIKRAFTNHITPNKLLQVSVGKM